MRMTASNPKNVIIVCEDIYGLDIYTMVEAINARARELSTAQYHVIGFISDEQNPFNGVVSPAPILGEIRTWQVDSNIGFIMGIRNPKKKEIAVRTLKSKGAFFETLITPWTLLPFEFEAGEGCIIGNYSCKHKSVFGDFVILDTVMCETVEVGNYSTLCPFANITNAKIGEKVYIGPHAVVMEHKIIGDGAIIEPGSVVVTNIRENSKVRGIPAKRIRE